MKPLVIYHKGCMDGAGAALAAWLRLGEDAEYRPAAYGDPAPTNEEVRGRDVYVLDFSYPRVELERMRAAQWMAESGGRVLRVLDHHKTAQKDLEGLPFCIFDMGKSGAVLAWDYFHGNTPPDLFAYIQDRDLWQWKLPNSKEISAALFSKGATEEFRRLIPIYRLWASNEEPGQPFGKTVLISEGAAILRTEAQMIARAVSTAEEITLDGHRCLAVSCPFLQSEIGEALAIEGARLGLSPIGVVWHRHGAHDGAYRVSLRSRDIKRTTDHTDLVVAEAPDVSTIAKKLDPKGGGHHRAAGFECKVLPWVCPMCHHELDTRDRQTADLGVCSGTCARMRQILDMGGRAALSSFLEYTGGDRDSQARAWSAVFRQLCDKGMPSTGKTQAQEYIDALVDPGIVEKTRAHTVAEVRDLLYGEWIKDVWCDYLQPVEAIEAEVQVDLLLARIGATMEEIG